MEDKTSDYYFSGKQVLEKAVVDDEWEGVVTDPELIEIMGIMSPFWRNVLPKVTDYLFLEKRDHTVLFSRHEFDESNLRELKEKKMIPKYKWEVFWTEDLASARKKGWDWSGDTEVTIYIIESNSLEDVVYF